MKRAVLLEGAVEAEVPSGGNKPGAGVILMQFVPLLWVLGKGLSSSPRHCMW